MRGVGAGGVAERGGGHGWIGRDGLRQEAVAVAAPGSGARRGGGALPAGSGYAETPDDSNLRRCTDLFEAYVAAKTAWQAAPENRTTPPSTKPPHIILDVVHALPGTTCSEDELTSFFRGQSWDLDDARDAEDASADREARLLRFTFTPPFFEHFFAKLLLGGFGPSTLVSVKLEEGTVARTQSQGIK